MFNHHGTNTKRKKEREKRKQMAFYEKQSPRSSYSNNLYSLSSTHAQHHLCSLMCVWDWRQGPVDPVKVSNWCKKRQMMSVKRRRKPPPFCHDQLKSMNHFAPLHKDYSSGLHGKVYLVLVRMFVIRRKKISL